MKPKALLGLAAAAVLLLGACQTGLGPTGSRIVLNLDGAVGLAIGSQIYLSPAAGIPRGYSNLYAIYPDGSRGPALVAGDLTLHMGMLSGPNGKLYFPTGGPGNTTVEGDAATGQTRSLGQQSMIVSDFGGSVHAMNPAVQSDASGNIYCWVMSSNGETLRRYGTTAVTDLLALGMSLVPYDYLVMPDGNVLVMTNDISTCFIKRIDPSGAVSNVFALSNAGWMNEFMRLFPDGKVYVSFFAKGRTDGVYALLPDFTIAASPALDFSACADVPQNGGASVTSMMVTTGGKVYGIDAYSHKLYEYYPAPVEETTSVDTGPGGTCVAGNSLVLFGTNASAVSGFAVYDTIADTEGAFSATGYDVKHFAYSPSASWVLFSGLDAGLAPKLGRIELGAGDQVVSMPLDAGESYGELLGL